ncbi:hypothetical protein BUALT_Bualt01G0004800 [Buddleja alternifolia]|uniref:Cytochrome P450 n=1 Tax=Buddleja alternifolia TaxID=168488 RepID=A0AAV6Y4R2_9LAMI|nr:hypothetical protein BUALT_Bualt01G0004800 [Buddleja alternifolia]
MGWRILGENKDFALLGPEKFVKDRMTKYSPKVFQTSLFGEKLAIFCGAQGNKFLFTNEDKLLTSWWPQSLRKVFLFPEYIETSLEEASALRRSFHHDIFKPEALRQYIPVMDALARDHLDQEWDPNEVVKVFPLSKKFTFELACKLFLSVVESEYIKRLIDPFTLMINGMFSIPIDFPGTAYNRAIKDDGKIFSEMEICISIIALLVASFDTTSSAITSVMNYLAQQPHIYEEVLKRLNFEVFSEQMEIEKSKGPYELLSWEDIEKMKYLWNVVRESLRLAPPSQGAFRETIAEFTYAGFTIPKGWKTFWTVHSSHKNPEYFPEPEGFDPSRFEGSGPAPYTFVPFGGRPRMCPGKEYARLEVVIFIHNVVKRFKFQKTIPNEKIVFYSSPTSVHGLPVRLYPHQK